MTDKATSNPLVTAFADQKVKLPLRMSVEDTGVILDDDGVDVITIDVNNTRPDGRVTTITALVVEAINHLAGFEENHHG